MVFALLVLFGICLGSFVNALVWRIHEQDEKHTKSKKLSILNGRSMCPHCKHELAVKDLVPVLSWLALRGKCRYCHKAISWQYPAVELLTVLLFVASYIWWPAGLHNYQISVFVLWLVLLVGLVALFVYDLRWFLLPNRIIYPSSVVAAILAIIRLVNAASPAKAALNLLLAVVIGGGIFFVLFQISNGKWIGGGDVRLGWILGLVAGTPARSILFIFLASIIGTAISLPLIYSHKLKRSSIIPFGPLLITGLFITQLFGSSILNWYQYHFLYF
jgi:leader peptidase (prepilin peptidase)/N-methyltransferase